MQQRSVICLLRVHLLSKKVHLLFLLDFCSQQSRRFCVRLLHLYVEVAWQEVSATCHYARRSMFGMHGDLPLAGFRARDSTCIKVRRQEQLVEHPQRVWQ